MYLDIELDERELAILERGGFLSFVSKRGIKIIIVKEEEETDERDTERETL